MAIVSAKFSNYWSKKLFTVAAFKFTIARTVGLTLSVSLKIHTQLRIIYCYSMVSHS